MMFILAFIAGCIGAILGGTQAFVAYGIAGMIVTVLELAGIDTAFYQTTVMNLFLLPAVMFNGNVVATAYAGKKYDIKGWDVNKSLTFTRDPFVILIGGVGSLTGYLIFNVFVTLGLPADQGAATVLTVGVITRFIFHRGKQYNKDMFQYMRNMPLKNWLYDIVIGIVCATAAGYFVIETKLLFVPFYFSAVSLILCFIDAPFPSTHQVTMVAAYAAFYSGNLLIAVLFGVIGQIICTWFTAVFNSNFETHVDPPAVSILTCSFIIFLLFR